MDGVSVTVMFLSRTMREFEKRLTREVEALNGKMDAMLRRKKKLETEIENLAKIIAQDDFSPALRKALTDRENEVASITEKVLAA